jgi:hypothetical protein
MMGRPSADHHAARLIKEYLPGRSEQDREALWRALILSVIGTASRR